MDILVPDEMKHLYVRNGERPVYKIPAPVLRQKAVEIRTISKKVLQTADDMIAIMKKARGIGLAAPQVGLSQRMIVIAPEGIKPTVMINPRILESAGEVVMEEGCLSIPGLYGDVTRPEKVVVEAYDRKGRRVEYELEDMPARVVQHEIDHLEGILFIDLADPATLHWTDPEKAPEPAE